MRKHACAVRNTQHICIWSLTTPFFPTVFLTLFFFLLRLPRQKWGTNLKEHTKRKLNFKNSDLLFVIKNHCVQVFDVLEEWGESRLEIENWARSVLNLRNELYKFTGSELSRARLEFINCGLASYPNFLVLSFVSCINAFLSHLYYCRVVSM